MSISSGGQRDWEVVVVGAGPAGLSTWLHLQALAPDLAERTLVLEKSVHPRDKVCGGAITPLGDLLLRGLRLDIETPAIEVQQILFRAGEAALPFRQPSALRVVSRSLFDAALAAAAVDRGLDLRQREPLVQMEARQGHVALRTSRGDYTARVVVAADGAHSVVRQQLALDEDSHLARLIEIVAPADPAVDLLLGHRIAVFDFTAVSAGLQGYVWHFPCYDRGVPAVNRGIYDSRVHPERARSDLRGVFAEVLRQRGLAIPQSEWKSHPLRWYSPEATAARPSVLLVGDAAGVDALLGEGITPALDYGDFAANFLIDAFERGDFSFADHRERFLAHPLGRSLAERHRMAVETYAEGGVDVNRLPQVMRRLLGSA